MFQNDSTLDFYARYEWLHLVHQNKMNKCFISNNQRYILNGVTYKLHWEETKQTLTGFYKETNEQEANLAAHRET